MTGRKWKHLIAALLACCLALPPFAARAAEEGTAVTIGTGVREKPTAEVTVRWDDGWFAGDPAVYRPRLAETAMALSGAAYVGTARGISVQAALEDLGFDQIQSYNYQFTEDSASRTAYTFAVRTVKDKDGAPVPLAAVVIRGTGVYTEWAGNLNVGTGSEHQGFAQAADELLENLKAYLPAAGVTGKAKFLITGHSRGGAAANLTAARLPETGLAERGDVFAYTFAAPAVSTQAETEGYENIFNIVSGCDLVPQVPLAQWGYGRYGVDVVLPAPEEDGERFAAMSKQYEALTGRPYAALRDPGTVETLTDTLARLAPTVTGPNMAMLSALLQGDMEGLSALVQGNPLAALLMARTAVRASSELTPLIQQEAGGLAAAHCMAGYYSWLSAYPEA